jgi:hypothetical protein
MTGRYKIKRIQCRFSINLKYSYNKPTDSWEDNGRIVIHSLINHSSLFGIIRVESVTILSAVHQVSENGSRLSQSEVAIDKHWNLSDWVDFLEVFTALLSAE